jgi:hypothetical protein
MRSDRSLKDRLDPQLFLRHLSLLSPGSIRRPVQGDGRGPRLVGRAETLAGEGVEILAKAATRDLL